MIVFLSNPQLINALMYEYPNKRTTVYNLSSCYSGYIDITSLVKLSSINDTRMTMPDFVNSVEFDMQYASNIMNNPIMFTSFMQIMSSAYEGDLVIILVYRDLYRDAIMESLIKFIQQRYGYNCWIIEDIDDVECVKEETFVPYGLLNISNDLQIFDEKFRDIRNEISIE